MTFNCGRNRTKDLLALGKWSTTNVCWLSDEKTVDKRPIKCKLNTNATKMRRDV